MVFLQQTSVVQVSLST